MKKGKIILNPPQKTLKKKLSLIKNYISDIKNKKFFLKDFINLMKQTKPKPKLN